MSSSSAAASSVQLLDKLASAVSQLPAGASSASGSCGIPTETKDKRWLPIIPSGHTAYTFYGVDEAHPNGVINADALTAPVAAKPSTTAAPATATAASSSKAAKPTTAAATTDKPVAAEKKEKKEKAAAKPAAASSSSAAEPDQPEYTKLDIRVGQIVSAKRHPKPEVTSLYVEMIDVGEVDEKGNPAPRQIVSGLVKYIPLEQFQTQRVCVICNLKPSPLQGEMSSGMVLAASHGEGDARVVELIQPPEGSKPGDRIVPLDSDYSKFKPLAQVDPRKKDKKTGEPDNAWARVAATLKTNEKGEATWDGKLLGTKAGAIATSSTLKNATIA